MGWLLVLSRTVSLALGRYNQECRFLRWTVHVLIRSNRTDSSFERQSSVHNNFLSESTLECSAPSIRFIQRLVNEESFCRLLASCVITQAS
jgi:hypothetical protein